MRRWIAIGVIVVVCGASAGVGYWVGFRDGWHTGLAADFVPRGVVALQQLQALRAGKPEIVVIGLEHDIDQGLIWGYNVFNHPMRSLWAPLWDINVYPMYEPYATRLADYRKTHPSSMSGTLFDRVPPDKPELKDLYRELAQSSRDAKAQLDHMIERYATKK
jgi:hypothetical protein